MNWTYWSQTGISMTWWPIRHSWLDRSLLPTMCCLYVCIPDSKVHGANMGLIRGPMLAPRTLLSGMLRIRLFTGHSSTLVQIGDESTTNYNLRQWIQNTAVNRRKLSAIHFPAQTVSRFFFPELRVHDLIFFFFFSTGTHFTDDISITIQFRINFGWLCIKFHNNDRYNMLHRAWRIGGGSTCRNYFDPMTRTWNKQNEISIDFDLCSKKQLWNGSLAHRRDL